MNRYRIHTTISTKHWELLQKYTEKYNTQQKVIEAALESLESGSKQNSLSSEDQLWVGLVRSRKVLCVTHRELFRELIKTADIEKIMEVMTRFRWEYILEFYYNKSIKNFNLKEIMDGIIITAEIGNWFDSINYIDNGSYYTLTVIHNHGINGSKINKALFEDLFKEYGVKIESQMTDISFFMKVFKNIEY